MTAYRVSVVGGHAVPAVDDAGHGGDRDAGELCDVVDRHSRGLFHTNPLLACPVANSFENVCTTAQLAATATIDGSPPTWLLSQPLPVNRVGKLGLGVGVRRDMVLA